MCFCLTSFRLKTPTARWRSKKEACSIHTTLIVANVDLKGVGQVLWLDIAMSRQIYQHYGCPDWLNLDYSGIRSSQCQPEHQILVPTANMRSIQVGSLRRVTRRASAGRGAIKVTGRSQKRFLGPDFLKHWTLNVGSPGFSPLHAIDHSLLALPPKPHLRFRVIMQSSQKDLIANPSVVLHMINLGQSNLPRRIALQFHTWSK